jgi:hypothetical protein
MPLTNSPHSEVLDLDHIIIPTLLAQFASALAEQ